MHTYIRSPCQREGLTVQEMRWTAPKKRMSQDAALCRQSWQRCLGMATSSACLVFSECPLQKDLARWQVQETARVDGRCPDPLSAIPDARSECAQANSRLPPQLYSYGRMDSTAAQRKSIEIKRQGSNYGEKGWPMNARLVDGSSRIGTRVYRVKQSLRDVAFAFRLCDKPTNTTRKKAFC